MSMLHHPESVSGVPWHCLNEEMQRLRTFSNYNQLSSKSSILLARNGFAYIGTGRDDSVICVFCFLRHQDWSNNDDISVVHKRLSPNCSFFVHGDSTNIAIGSSHSQVTDDDIVTDSSMDEADSLNISAYPSASIAQMTVLSDPPAAPGTAVASEPFSEEVMHEDSSRSNTGADNVVSQLVRTPQIHNQSQNIETLFTQPSVTSRASQSRSIPTQMNGPINDLFQPPAMHAPSSRMASNQPQRLGFITSTGTGTVEDRMNCSKLGIFVERPKRPEYATRQARQDTFYHWPRDHHIPITDLVEGGLYYAGYADCARCYYCGGGLRSWEPEDNVYVEHARWFPKCAFIRQTLGESFIKAVQELSNEGIETITLDIVLDKIGTTRQQLFQGAMETVIHNDAAVLALCDIGYHKTDVVQAAKALYGNENVLSAESLLDRLKKDNKYPQNCEVRVPYEHAESDPRVLKEKKENLKTRNQELRRQSTCKVCWVKPLDILFLPCSHLACCTDCATCLRTCPICRKDVRGVVRVNLCK